MRHTKGWILLASLLTGCAHYQSLTSQSPTDIGQRAETPIGIVTGEASSIYFMTFGPFGDGSQSSAMARARGRALEADLVNVIKDYKVTCFPSCDYPLFKRMSTLVTGTLVKPSRYVDPPAPPAAQPIISPRDPAPSAETLCARFASLYREDPAAAAEYYRSLGSGKREELRDYILANKGIRSAYNSEFKVPAETGPEERKFLGWFLTQYTSFQPVYESRD